MRIFYAPETEAHVPEFFLARGRVVSSEERSQRAELLLAAVRELGLSPQSPENTPLDRVLTVHTPRYLDFLRDAFAVWHEMPQAGLEVVANVQPRRPEASYPDGILGRAGWHLGDLACPIGKHTYHAARRAADSAVAAARAVAEGEKSAYALCRPPGHHASDEVAAGHCYLNNAAIAASVLQEEGARPAVLDIDVHHGNGTQAIFYDRDLLTVSVHMDPHSIYPWFTGHTSETGVGPGEGFNRNLPLERGTSDEAWLDAVQTGIELVERDGADAMVLALGLDVHTDDPLGGLDVSTDGIRRGGTLVGATRLPVAVTQEGGYLSPSLSTNAKAFFEGFLSARPS
ncbi:MAG: histone deacetylase family protein [Pseudomonadota bacterium]